MKTIDRLLLENKAWAQEKLSLDPDYLTKLRQPRSPEIFWIGCSDSRVHADQITQSEPGEIFVHRNIANQVAAMDMSFLAALEFAVDKLDVRHVIVCGHYGCGGVGAAMGRARPSQLFVNKWLKPIKDVYRLHRAEVEGCDGENARHVRLVELNVIEHVNNLAQTSVIQRAWRRDSRPDLHGWVYGLHDAIIREIACLRAGTSLDPIYEYDLE